MRKSTTIRITKFLSFIGLFLFLLSCKKNSNPVDFHYSYFPISEGRYITFNATEIIHDIESDTSTYQLKIVIGEDFIDDQKDTAQKVYRYVKLSDTSGWEIRDVWWRKIIDRKAIQYEENIPYVKLHFRPELSKTWDGNAQNDQSAWEYTYEWIHEPYNTSSFSFENTVRVNQRDFKTLVDYQEAYEIYAKDVGMIKKYYKNLVIENFDSTQISTGQELYLEYTDHGNQ